MTSNEGINFGHGLVKSPGVIYMQADGPCLFQQWCSSAILFDASEIRREITTWDMYKAL